ncbi:MAG: type I-E CRISPR-associated protein Cas5/CasD [Pseudomonadota bacterium]
MPQALVFTLAASLASFGAVAVGERRPTWDRPGKSQIIGLLACALGIERSDETRQADIANGLALAIRVDDPGHLSTDFHTAQVPPQRRNRKFATRAEELGVAKTDLKTILSRREYRVGGRYTIAVWYDPDRADMLEQFRLKLTQPEYILFAGRKAFPLMLPTYPQIVARNDDVEATFSDYDRALTDDMRFLIASVTARRRHRPQIFVDADALPGSQLVDRIEERRDVPESREKWRFGLRSEALLRQRQSSEEPAP